MGAVKRHEFRIEVAARLRLSHETVTAFLAAYVGGPPVRRSNASSRARSSVTSVSDMIRIAKTQPLLPILFDLGWRQTLRHRSSQS
jgi:hypothetical protein